MTGNKVQVASHHGGWAVETASSTVSRHILETENAAIAAATRNAQQTEIELPIHWRGRIPARNSPGNDSHDITG